MATRKVLFFISSYCLLFLAACVRHYSLLPSVDPKTVNLRFPIQAKTITIIDARDIVSKGETFTIPFPLSNAYFSKEKFYPEVEQVHEELIKQTINNNTQGELDYSKSGDYIIYLKEAWKQFEGSNQGETERIYFDIEIKLIVDGEAFYGKAKQEFFNQSQKATKWHFEEFYQLGLQNLVVNALKGVQTAYFFNNESNEDCFSNKHEKSYPLSDHSELLILGKSPLEARLTVPPSFEIKEPWTFTIYTDASGQILDLQLLDNKKLKSETLRMVNFISSIRFLKVGSSSPNMDCNVLKFVPLN